MLTASEAARARALVVDQGERGTLVVSGPDRLGWLNGIVTCDVAKVAPGQGAWGLILSKTGKVLSDLYVVASADRVFVSVAAGKAGELRDYFDRMLVMEDAEIGDRTPEHVWLALHGPEAARAAEAAVAAAGGAYGSIDWTGLGGAALVVDRSRASAARAALVDLGVPAATPDDWTSLRLERGVGVFGVDFGPDDNPHEAALDQRAVSWNKGCYLGQEVVCMQGMRGKVKRRLVSLTLGGRDVPAPGAAVVQLDGTEVGEVTSAAWSARLGRVVALARIQGGVLDARDAVTVGGAPASVIERPEP